MSKSIKSYILSLRRQWWKIVFLGFLVLLLALFLRTYNLHSIPVFADEAIYVRWAQVMRAEPTLRFLPLSDGKQPLFMWTVMPFLKIFSDPVVAGRMVSVLTGLASLVGIFLLTLRLLKSKRAALIAALFYAVSPFSVFFDRMALVDSMLASFGIWALYFGVVTAQTLRLDAAMLTGFSLGAAWLTKSPALFFLIMLPTTAIVSFWPKEREAKALHAAKILGLFLVSWVIAGAMYNIQRLGPNFHLIASRNKDYVFSVAEALQHPLDPFQFHIRDIVEWFWLLLPGTIFLLALAGIALGWRKYKRELILLIVWTVFPLLVQAEFAKVFTARYILFAAPPLFVLAAIPASLALLRLKSYRFWLVLAAAVLPALWIDYLLLVSPEKAPLPRVERSGYLEEWTAGTGIREVAFYIKKEHEENPERQIVVGTEGFFGTLPDGLQAYLEKVPKVVVIGIGLNIDEVRPQLLEAKRAGDKVYLVVNSTRFVGDAEELGLRLIKSFPKAEKPDGTRESLLLFEVTDEALEKANHKDS